MHMWMWLTSIQHSIPFIKCSRSFTTIHYWLSFIIWHFSIFFFWRKFFVYQNILCCLWYPCKLVGFVSKQKSAPCCNINQNENRKKKVLTSISCQKEDCKCFQICEARFERNKFIVWDKCKTKSKTFSFV